MSLQDPYNTKQADLTLLKDYVDTAPTGSDNVSCDTKGFRFAKVTVKSGTLTGGTSWAWKVQQSSDNASSDAFADIEAVLTAKTSGTFLAANDQATHIIIIDLTAVERYLKLAWTKTGTFTVSQLSASIELFNPVDSDFLGSEILGFYP